MCNPNERTSLPSLRDFLCIQTSAESAAKDGLIRDMMSFQDPRGKRSIEAWRFSDLVSIFCAFWNGTKTRSGRCVSGMMYAAMAALQLATAFRAVGMQRQTFDCLSVDIVGSLWGQNESKGMEDLTLLNTDKDAIRKHTSARQLKCKHCLPHYSCLMCAHSNIAAYLVVRLDMCEEKFYCFDRSTFSGGYKNVFHVTEPHTKIDFTEPSSWKRRPVRKSQHFVYVRRDLCCLLVACTCIAIRSREKR